MGDMTPFHFEDGHDSFEEIGEANGGRYWPEGALQDALGYKTRQGFRGAMNRALQACVALSIDPGENFKIQPDGTYRFTRFACYLIAMNGNSSKPRVAAAQMYFAAIAETFQNAVEAATGVERVVMREELKDGQKSLSSTAAQHGIKNYAFFQNQGYRGMYNMSLSELCHHKGAEKKKLLDRMDRTELAANLFRITQTESKIQNEKIYGQKRLEDAAFNVGRSVRRSMEEISGQSPESLPLAEPIGDVKKQIKGARRKLTKIDAPKKRSKGKKK